jgi:hypothetical protein
MFLLPCSQRSTSSSVCNHQASFWCWAEAIFVGNVMPSTWGLLQNRTNHLSLAFSERLSLGVFEVGMFITTLAVFNTSTYLSFVMKTRLLLSWRTFLWYILPVRCRCRGLLLCLFTLTRARTRTHTHTHPLYHSFGRGIGPSQRPLPV